MTGRDVDALECIELAIFLIFYLEYLSVFSLAQLFKDLVVPQTTCVSHVASHLFYFI